MSFCSSFVHDMVRYTIHCVQVTIFVHNIQDQRSTVRVFLLQTFVVACYVDV